MFGVGSRLEFLLVRAPYAVQLAQPFDAVNTSADTACLQLGLYLVRSVGASAALVCRLDVEVALPALQAW